MDRREFIKLGLVSFVSASVPIPIYHYIINNKGSLRKEIDIVKDNMKEFELKIAYNSLMTGELKRLEAEAMGIIYGDYLLTVAHATEAPSEKTSFGPIPVETVEAKFKLEGDPLELVVQDSPRDIAIFKLGKHKRPKIPAKFGSYDDLKLLDDVYLIGNPMGLGYNVREGIVGNDLKERMLINGERDEGFNVSTGGFWGDSGTPIIDSRGKVVGLLSQVHWMSSAYIKPIDWYKEEIRKYEEAK